MDSGIADYLKFIVHWPSIRVINRHTNGRVHGRSPTGRSDCAPFEENKWVARLARGMHGYVEYGYHGGATQSTHPGQSGWLVLRETGLPAQCAASKWSVPGEWMVVRRANGHWMCPLRQVMIQLNMNRTERASRIFAGARVHTAWREFNLNSVLFTTKLHISHRHLIIHRVGMAHVVPLK